MPRRTLPLLVLLAAAGCSTGLHVRLLDAETIELDGEKVGWSELRRRVSARVADAAASGRPPPAVVLATDVREDAQLGNRVVDLLVAAGIKKIHFAR